MSRAVLARWITFLASPFLMAAAAPIPPPTPTGFPFTNETLNYTVNWPSGLSLGEAHMTATRAKTADGKDDGHRQREGSRQPQPDWNATQPPSARSR